MNSNNDSPASVVITDITCLIILEKNSLLYLLDKLFNAVLVTPEIAREYQSTLPDWVIVRPVINKAFQNQINLIVDAGEASSIALATELRLDFLITDDLEARRLCNRLAIPVIGTLGTLVRAKERGFLTSIKPILEQIEQTDFRISKELYQSIMKKSGEL